MTQENIAILDASKTQKNISSVIDGEGIESFLNVSKPFLLEVAMGRVEGYSFVDKFGRTTESANNIDVWEGNKAYPDDAFGTAPIQSIASTSASDTQNIDILRKDVTGAEETITITLQGTTRVAIPDSWKVERLENMSGDDIQGTVFAYTGAGAVPTDASDSRVRAIIENGNNQSLMAIYTIPLGKTAFLLKGNIRVSYAGTGFFSAPQALDCFYQSKRPNETFKVKESLSLCTQGTSSVEDFRPNYDIIPELTTIKINVNKTSDEDIAVSASFILLLVDNDKL